MVPHIYRQEMYVGEEFGIRDNERHTWRYYLADKNESPINLFFPDLKAYPNFRFVEN